jgi:hypothetical protein
LRLKSFTAIYCKIRSLRDNQYSPNIVNPTTYNANTSRAARPDQPILPTLPKLKHVVMGSSGCLLQNKKLGQMYWLTLYQIIAWLVEAILSMIE